MNLIKKPRYHRYNLVPTEEKESYKWIESSLSTKKVLEQAKEIIIIQDREGDIYEQFCLIPDKKNTFIDTGKNQSNSSRKTKAL